MDSCLEQLSGMVATATDGMSEEELSRHPEGKWCAAELLEHLYLTYTGTIKGMERALGAGKPLVTKASLQQRLARLAVCGFGYLPEGRQAPAMARPRGLPREQVKAEITRKIAAMDEMITRCEERFGRGRQLLDHVILGPLTGAQWRKFHLVHGRHHLKQLRRLREGMRLP